MADTCGGFRAKGTGTIGGRLWCYRPPPETRRDKHDILAIPRMKLLGDLKPFCGLIRQENCREKWLTWWVAHTAVLCTTIYCHPSLPCSIVVEGSICVLWDHQLPVTWCCRDTWWQVHLLWLFRDCCIIKCMETDLWHSKRACYFHFHYLSAGNEAVTYA